MLDIDFLSAAHPSLRQHVIYTYSTGLLRGPVRIRLNQLYKAKGLICGDAPPNNPLLSIYEESLLGPEAIFIDTVRYDNISTDLPDFLPDLEMKAVPNSVIFFVPEGAAFLQTPSWLAFAKTATVLEEARLSKNALPKLVAFFGASSSVFDYRHLTNKADLLAALQETLKFESNWTLVEFQQRLEFLAVMCVVEQTFDKVLFRKYAPPSSKEDFYKFHKAVFEFLLAKTEEKLIPVVQLFSQEYFTPPKETQPKERVLVGLLYKITFDLVAVNLELNRGQVPKDWSAYKKAKLMACKGLPVVNLYKWMNILAREEARFSKRNFVAALHDVCCLYVESFDAPV
ncbi:MAG: hypothetical protein ACLP4V_31905 [Methylocella sp.]